MCVTADDDVVGGLEDFDCTDGETDVFLGDEVDA